MNSATETRLGSLVAAGGIIWAAHVSTAGFHNLYTLLPLPAGPLEVIGIGVLIWLHSKWRGSVRLK